jgi:hypothetical protein
MLPFLRAERPGLTTLLGDRASVKKNHADNIIGRISKFGLGNAGYFAHAFGN